MRMAGPSFLFALVLFTCVFTAAEGAFIQASGVRSFGSVSFAGERILSCNNCTANLTMPFDFTFGTRTTSTIAVSSNGFVSLDPTDERPACCSPVSIAESAANRARIAVLQTGLNLDRGAVFSLCTTLSCVVSYENVSFVQHPGAMVSAQVELFADGSLDFRYSNTSVNLAPTVLLFTSGVQDTTSAISIPIVMGPCSPTTGICSGFPTSSSVRLSDLVEALNRSEFSRMSATLAISVANNTATNSRAVSALASLATSISATASSSRAGRQFVANEVSKATARSLGVHGGYLQFLSSLSQRAQGSEGVLASAIVDEELRATQAINEQTSRALDAETGLFNNVAAVQAIKQGISSALRTQTSASRRAGFAQTSRAVSAASAIQAQVRQRTSTALGAAARLAFNLSTAERTVKMRANTTDAQISAAARDVLSTQVQTDVLQVQFAAALASLSETYSSLVQALPSTASNLELQAADNNANLATLANTAIEAFASSRHSAQANAANVFVALSSALSSEKSSQQGVMQAANNRFASLTLRTLAGEAALDQQIAASVLSQSRSHSTAMSRLSDRIQIALLAETSRAAIARSILDDAALSASVQFASMFSTQQRTMAQLASSQLQTLQLAHSQASQANTRLEHLSEQEASRAATLSVSLDQAQSSNVALWSSIQSALSQGIQEATSSVAEKFNMQRALISTTQESLWSKTLLLFPALSTVLDAMVTEQASHAFGRLLIQSSLASQLAQDFSHLDTVESQIADALAVTTSAQHARTNVLNASILGTVSSALASDQRIGLSQAQFSSRVDTFFNQSLSGIARATSIARESEGELSRTVSNMTADQSRREAMQDSRLAQVSSHAIAMEQELDVKLQAFIGDTSVQQASLSTTGTIAAVDLGTRLESGVLSLSEHANRVATSQQSTLAAQISAWSSTALEMQSALQEGVINTTNAYGSGSEEQLSAEASVSSILDVLETDTLSRADDALDLFVNGSLAAETSRKTSTNQQLSQALLDTSDEVLLAVSTAGSIVVVHLAEHALVADASISEWTSNVQSVDSSLAANMQSLTLGSNTQLRGLDEQLTGFRSASSQALRTVAATLTTQDEAVSQARESFDRMLAETSTVYEAMQEVALSTTTAWLSSNTLDLDMTLQTSLSSLFDAAARGAEQRDALEAALNGQRSAAQRDLVDSWLSAASDGLNITEEQLEQETLRSLEQHAVLVENLSSALALHENQNLVFEQQLQDFSNRSQLAFDEQAGNWSDEVQRGNDRDMVISGADAEAGRQMRLAIDIEASRLQTSLDILSALTLNESLASNKSIEQQILTVNQLDAEQQDVQRLFSNAREAELFASSSLSDSLESYQALRLQTEASLGRSLANETSRSVDALLKLNNASTIREVQLSSTLDSVNGTLQEALRAYTSQAQLEERALMAAISAARLAWAQDHNASIDEIIQLNSSTAARFADWQANATLQGQVRRSEHALLQQTARSMNASLFAESQALSTALSKLRETALALIARLTTTNVAEETDLHDRAEELFSQINIRLLSLQSSLVSEAERGASAAIGLTTMVSNETQLFSMRTNVSVTRLHATIRELQALFAGSLQLFTNRKTTNSQTWLADVEAHKQFFSASMHFLANRPQESTSAWELSPPNRNICAICPPVLLTACLVPDMDANESGPLMPAALARGASLPYRIHILRTQPELFQVRAVSPNATLLLADGLAAVRLANINASCMNVTGFVRSTASQPVASLTRRSAARRSAASLSHALQEIFQAATASNSTSSGGWVKKDTTVTSGSEQTTASTSSSSSLFSRVKVLLLVWTALVTFLLLAIVLFHVRNSRSAAQVDPKFVFPQLPTSPNSQQGSDAQTGGVEPLVQGAYTREARLSRRGRTVGYLVSPLPSHEVRKNVQNPLFVTDNSGDSPKQDDGTRPISPALSVSGTHVVSPRASVVDDWMRPATDRSSDEWVTRDKGPRWQSPPSKASELVTMTDL